MTVTHEGSDTGYEYATDQAHQHDHHPKDTTYWKAGLVLAILTALEVSTYFIADPPYDHELSYVLIGSLIIMMVLKFVVIVAYFMHVKFDNALFRNVFVAGLVLAVGVYIVMLLTFRYFSPSYEADTYDTTPFPAAEADG